MQRPITELVRRVVHNSIPKWQTLKAVEIPPVTAPIDREEIRRRIEARVRFAVKEVVEDEVTIQEIVRANREIYLDQNGRE